MTAKVRFLMRARAWVIPGFMQILFGLSSCTTAKPAGHEKAFWENLDQPSSVMAAYISALRSGEIEQAIHYLYLPPDVPDPTVLRDRMRDIARSLQSGGESIHVADSRMEKRLALVLYCRETDPAKPIPVFLILDANNHWRLHHRETAGPLQNALRDRYDFLEMRSLATWGARRMAELNHQAIPPASSSQNRSYANPHIAAE